MTTSRNPINDQDFTRTLEYLQQPETFDYYDRILSACQVAALEVPFPESDVPEIDILIGLHQLRKDLRALSGVPAARTLDPFAPYMPSEPFQERGEDERP